MLGRLSLVVVLLVAALAIIGSMAFRAQLAAREQRRIAQDVVRDWTRVAADELARRAADQAQYYGTYRVLQTLSASSAPQPAEALRTAARTPIERRNAALVGRTFRYMRDSGAPPELAAILNHPPPPEEQKPIAIGDRIVVYMVSADKQRIDGFDVNRAALGPFFALALSMRPILPRTLNIGNDAIRARALDAHGALLFATRDAVTPTLAVRQRAPDDSLLRGVTVEASLAPNVMHLIIAGGIPQPAYVYFILFAVAGALLIAAMLQIGRERALARLRADFVASVSHELRTPLTQIRMFAETLQLDRVRSDDERRRSLRIINQEAQRLGQLVENVLQFSRGERRMLHVAPRRQDVGAIVRSAIDSFYGRDVRIDARIADDATATVDDAAIRQIVLNLLDNAAKYGPAEQEIVVEVERAADHVRIAVDDEGPGVPRRWRRRIWQRYARIPRERERAIAGAGIGLAVVRDLVRLQHGHAWCESGTRGGARFIVEVPA